MALRLLATMFGTMRATGFEGPDVHFHRGPQGRPAVCYDGGCSRPRLAID